MNLRVFKKDIEFVIEQFLGDCDLVLLLNPSKDANEIYQIEEEAINLYNDLRVRANHPEGDKRAYYRGLIEEMYTKIDELCEKLSEVVASKK